MSNKSHYGSVIIIALCLFGLAACSPGSNSGQNSTSTTLLNTGQSKAEITNAYTTLFDLSNPSIGPKVAVTQDGSQLEVSMKSAFGSSLSKAAGSAKVINVTLGTKQSCIIADEQYPCAVVSYNLMTPSGSPIFSSPSTGYAVYSKNKWLVAKNTVCSLLTLANSNKIPQGC